MRYSLVLPRFLDNLGAVEATNLVWDSPFIVNIYMCALRKIHYSRLGVTPDKHKERHSTRTCSVSSAKTSALVGC